MPSREHVRRALALVVTPADTTYFFSRLTSSSWIDPLVAEGRFATPPEVVHEERGVRFPSWPELEYLNRVAADAPALAASVLALIPATDNQRVHLDMVEVALQLPPSSIRDWIRAEIQWFASQNSLWLLLPERYAELAARLADHQELALACELTKSLLAVIPDPSWESGEKRYFHPVPIGRMDGWDYRKATETITLAFAAQADENTLAVMCGLLADALRLSSAAENREPPVDYSFIWRDSIEDSERRDSDLRDILIDSVRDISVAVAEKVGCERVVALLHEARWDVFRRIALHVVRRCCVESASALRACVLSEEAFNDPSIRHEYVLLLQAGFERILEADQNTLLGWIERGPNRDAMRARHDAATDDEIQAWVEHWQRDRLAPLKDVLPAQWQERLAELVDRHGAPEFDLNSHTSGVNWVGDLSPLSSEQIKTLRGDDLCRFLREWVPGEERGQPTRAGVVQQLNALDEAFFVTHARDAASWSDLHPAYIAALLRGLEKTVSAEIQIEWDSVLSLCESVARFEGTADDYRWAKLSVAALLIAAFNVNDTALPYAARDRTFDVIDALLTGSLNEGSEVHVSADVDYLTAGINSVLGKAVEALIREAVWVKRIETTSDADAQWQFDERAPSMSRRLRDLVRTQCDLPLHTRAIFGAQLSPLVWLDRDWVSSERDALFPSDETHADHRRAIWSTYLRYGHPYGKILDLFEDQYALAIANLPREVEERDGDRDESFRVAEHLMTYYWQGYLPANGPLMRAFLRDAPARLRRHALEYIGRSLHRSGEVPAEPLALLRDLLSRRIAALASTGEVAVKEGIIVELAGYGWWFTSGKFEAKWALDALLVCLRNGVGVDPLYSLTEALVRLAPEFQVEVAEVVRRLIDGPRADYIVSASALELRQVLAELATSDDATVQAMLAATVDRLLSHGYVQFRNLHRR
jgi:hypothetical protein